MVHKKSKKVLFLMVFLIALVSINLLNILQFDKVSKETSLKHQFVEDNNITLKVSAKSKIITINGNFELNKTAISGNGTRVNPYIIKYLEIDANGSLYCVLINNTDKFFTLIGCNLYNASYGIYLNNVSNGVITNTFACDHLKSGFFLKASWNNTIIGNYCFDNQQNGIFIENCSLNSIQSNLLWDNLYSGAYLNNSNNNNITSNSFNNNYYGIYLHSSNFTHVINNTGQNNVVGIREVNCKGNLFENNDFQRDPVSRDSEEDDDMEIKEIKKIIDFSWILIVTFTALICTIFGIKNVLNFYFKNKNAKRL